MAVDKDKDENKVPELAPVEDDDGNMILSEDIRQQQADAGYAPDIQPKAVVSPAEVGEHEVAPLQPTGNIVVETALRAVREETGKRVAKDTAKDSK